MRTFVRYYLLDSGLIVASALLVFITLGIDAMVRFFILGVLEISFSFDNAIVNAGVLITMSLAWRKRFNIYGFLVAAVGMRFFFPVLVVMLTARLGFTEVITLAFRQPELYAKDVEAAYPEILILGGIYLMLTFLTWLFGEKEVTWLSWIEVPLGKVGKLDLVPLLLAIPLVILISDQLNNVEVMRWGFYSIGLFVFVTIVSNLFEGEDIEDVNEKLQSGNSTNLVLAAGFAGFSKFIYLEVQDSAFSFDGVSGAFAITTSVVLIVLGLGVFGAKVMRSITLHMIDKKVLLKFVYLEHGAYWAIGTLGFFMLLDLFHEVSQYITGGIGIVFILAAFISSIRHNKANAANEPEGDLDELAASVDKLQGRQVDVNNG